MEAKILEILKDINEDIITYDGTDMLKEGIIDSYEIIEIVSRLVEEFNIEVDAEYVTAVNFSNKDTIVEMVKKIVQG